MKITIIRDPHTGKRNARTNGERIITYWKDDTWRCWIALEIDEKGGQVFGSRVTPDNFNAHTKSEIIEMVVQELKTETETQK